MTYSSYENAERCENSHLSAVSVKELEYRYGVYPSRITLTFSDGVEWDYIFDDSFYMGNEVNHAYDKNKRNFEKHKST